MLFLCCAEKRFRAVPMPTNLVSQMVIHRRYTALHHLPSHNENFTYLQGAFLKRLWM